MNGKPLYEYAREGKAIPREIEKRAVEVLELDLLEWYEGGTHEHKLPSEEAGAPEKQVAEALWKQEKLQDEKEGKESNDAETLAAKKRKHEDDQDGLVTDRPASKRRLSTQDANMSGGLDALDSQGNLNESHESATESPATGEVKQTDTAKETKQPEPEEHPPAAKIRMTVTSGFYVRSLCHDLGEAVGSAANMAELIRSRQGQFELGKNVLAYEDLEKGEKVWGPQVEKMLDDWPSGSKAVASSPAKIQSVVEEAPVTTEAQVQETLKVENDDIQKNAAEPVEKESTPEEIQRQAAEHS